MFSISEITLMSSQKKKQQTNKNKTNIQNARIWYFNIFFSEMVYTFREEDDEFTKGVIFHSERIKGYIWNGNESESKKCENRQSLLWCQKNTWLPRRCLWILVSRKLRGMQMSPAPSLKLSLTYKAQTKSTLIYTKQHICLPPCN